MLTEEQFSYLAKKYMDTVFRLAFHYTKSRSESDDITQEVLLKLYRADKAFESEDHVRHWLIRVTVNECKRAFLSPWKRTEPIEDYAEQLAFKTPEHSELFHAVMALPQKYRVPLFLHYYEGYSMEDVVLPTRLMKMMGAEVLFLTNAAGGVNWQFECGDFMLINDQICMAPSPLIGENPDELGPRFPDMSEIYSKELREVIRHTARDLDIRLREGVYIQLTGPNYESPSEVRMVRTLGADAVGMSTACEAIAANHMGMKIAGISCISNLACGVSNRPLSHAEVQETADKAAPLFTKLITESIKNIYAQM